MQTERDKFATTGLTSVVEIRYACVMSRPGRKQLHGVNRLFFMRKLYLLSVRDAMSFSRQRLALSPGKLIQSTA